MSYVVHDEPLRLDLTRRDLGMMCRALAKVYCGTRDPHCGWAQHIIEEYGKLITPQDRAVIRGVINHCRSQNNSLGDHDDATEWIRLANLMTTLNIADGAEEAQPTTSKKKSAYDNDGGD